MTFRSSFAIACAIGGLSAAAACENARRGGPIDIALHSTPGATIPASIVVSGLSAAELEACRQAAPRLVSEDWESILTVRVDQSAASAPPVKGRYTANDTWLMFTPLFPFDPGRSYQVRLDPAKLPQPRQSEVVLATLNVPAVVTTPAAVSGVHPSADAVPENLLRMYVEFSQPMGNSGARDFVKLIDRTAGTDQIVEEAFLPVEADFWSPDHRRYTLFFDPGRVKQGILPNRQSGRPLKAGHRYAIEISVSWTDANRQPLVAPFRHEFQATPTIDSAIRLTTWKVEPPAAGTRQPVVVTFPRPLDHAIVMRALGIEADEGQKIAGTASVDSHDTRWSFVPDDPWRAGEHRLTALSFLEDPQGNQINRPFEEAVDQLVPEHQPEVFRIVFGIPAKP